jgi:antitoxin MazE
MLGVTRGGSDMTVKVKRVGGRLTLEIPDDLAAVAGFVEDTEVSITTSPGQVVAKKKPKYTLAELVARITPENRHDYIDFGPPVGNEVW